MTDPPEPVVPILEYLKAVVEPLRESIASLDERIKELNERLDNGIKELNERLDNGIKELNGRLDKLLIGAILVLVGAVVSDFLTRATPPNSAQIADGVVAALRRVAELPAGDTTVVGPGEALSADAVVAGQALDFEYYRARVEPIFLDTRRVGDGRESCAFCHAQNDAAPNGAPRFLAALMPDAETWTVEQARDNFAAVSSLVVPGDPLDSRLLTYPLGVDVAGQPHPDMSPRITLNSPEYRTLAAWINGETVD